MDGVIDPVPIRIFMHEIHHSVTVDVLVQQLVRAVAILILVPVRRVSPECIGIARVYRGWRAR
mgnify:CR=1 FL=1